MTKSLRAQSHPVLREMQLTPIISMARLERLPIADFPVLIEKMCSSLDAANLYMSQSHLFAVAGNTDFALEMQARALELSRIYRMEGPEKPAIRLLVLMGAGEQQVNMPLDYLIADSDIRLDLLYILPSSSLPDVIPEHDVAIVALGESCDSLPVLDMMERLTENWPRPVINRAKAIGLCSRDGVYQRLKFIHSVLIPPTQRISREELALGLPVRQLTYPITLRPLYSFGGKGLGRIENARQLADYLAASPEQAFFISRFVDYRSPDGFYRKLRIALIDGAPYIAHLAISENWIVHYFSAGMEASAEKRAEEARVMQRFDSDFALRHGQALREIADSLGLDYVVLDCAETQDGKLLVFEVDNRGWVHASDPPDIFPYKQAPMRRLFAAFRAMLERTMNTTNCKGSREMNSKRGWHWPKIEGVLCGTMTDRERLGLPDYYMSTRFEDEIPGIYRDLLGKGSQEYAMMLESRETPLAQRLVVGNILALIGDPRISTLAPYMIDIPGGNVTIGLDESQIDSVMNRFEYIGLDEKWIRKECPEHVVSLKSFRMGKYPVTNFEYREFLQDSQYSELPSSWEFRRYPLERSNHPVFTLSSAAADAYAGWLSKKTGRSFRLPSEAEWEHAAAGFDRLEFPWGDEYEPDFSNTVETGLFSTSPVGMFVEGNSPFGVTDMAGNVEEYVLDHYGSYTGGQFISDHLVQLNGDYRVARGGCFSRLRDLTRTRRRHGRNPASQTYAMGFRLVEEI